MSYEKVLRASKVIIGTKQTAKALKNGQVQELVIAQDADPKVTESVINQALQMNVPILYVDSAKKLGKACRVDVGASTVAIIR
ncbi:ribosomal protein L7Ae-like protein [Bacillus sp. MUM 116]|uniref:50S ribosomal protein L7ae-like protein n=1 Tax=Bacillus sp. MUM 116 TaxID=1678002 RepID=UPI0008F564BF|nr:50S ribosomal protein L7ae-like protein [Bacillus sp. MUM 116]OIK14425.1 ribosomal protein L7Ae-like protein [Bacillus sp. MUM 116]